MVYLKLKYINDNIIKTTKNSKFLLTLVVTSLQLDQRSPQNTHEYTRFDRSSNSLLIYYKINNSFLFKCGEDSVN